MPDKCFTHADSVSLKEYIEVRLAAHEKAQDSALKLASDVMDIRLEHLNETYSRLQRLESTFLTTDSYNDKHDLLQRQVDLLRLDAARLDGKASQSAVDKTMLIAVISLIIGLVAAIHGFFK